VAHEVALTGCLLEGINAGPIETISLWPVVTVPERSSESNRMLSRTTASPDSQVPHTLRCNRDLTDLRLRGQRTLTSSRRC
jgi:hypothetical protein